MKLLNTTSNDLSKILLKIPFLKFDIKLFNTNKQYFFSDILQHCTNIVL